MQMMLVQNRSPELRAYFVWGPYVRSDNEEAARTAGQRFVAPNAVHYWTPNQKLSQDLGEVLRLGGGRIAWDVFLLYGKGAIWDRKIPAPEYWQHQLEILQGEPYNVPVLESRLRRALSR